MSRDGRIPFSRQGSEEMNRERENKSVGLVNCWARCLWELDQWRRIDCHHPTYVVGFGACAAGRNGWSLADALLLGPLRGQGRLILGRMQVQCVIKCLSMINASMSVLLTHFHHIRKHPNIDPPGPPVCLSP